MRDVAVMALLRFAMSQNVCLLPYNVNGRGATDLT
jgi:hypothetical protein